MSYYLGVENGHIFDRIGRFNPTGHKGVDVFAKPGSRVRVPLGWQLRIIGRSFNNKYKGQAWGWATIGGVRYGFVMAHFAAAPAVGVYESGDKLGRVALGTRSPNGQLATPHIHIALSTGDIPPPGTVDPVKVFESNLP